MPSSGVVTALAYSIAALLLSRWQQISFSAALALLFPVPIIALAIWKILLWPFLFSPLRALPEPDRASWINGHASLLPDERSGRPMNRWINEIENDGLIRYRVKFNRERLFVTSPKALSEVLVQKNYDFAKPRSLRLGLGRILGVGLIVAEGEEHKMQRRQLMPAFAYRHIKDLYPVFWCKAIELADALSSSPSPTTHSTKDEEMVVEISHWLARATLDIIGVAGLGEDFGIIQNPDHEIMHAYSGVFDQRPPKSKIKLLLLVVKELVVRTLRLKRNDSIAHAAGTLKGVARRLIRQKRVQMQSPVVEKVGRKDILSVALDSGIFTDDMMVNQLLTFLAAGHETTATSMTWALSALCRDSEVQDRLRAEVRERLPSPSLDSSEFTAEMIDNLPYLHAVCNEVLRLHPPAGLTKRVAAKDTSILGQYVAKGTDVVIVMRAINHSKELWREHAESFRPERWIESSSGGAESNFSFMTFLHGEFLRSKAIAGERLTGCRS